MALKIHGNALTTNTCRVLVAIYEKEVTDWELVTVALQAGEHKKQPYLDLQPFGVVPALASGPVNLFESRAIVRYIQDTYAAQGTPLYGSTPIDKALVDQWMEVEGQNYWPPVAAILWEKVLKLWRGLQTDQAVVDANIAKLNVVLDVYEAQLAKTKYIAGDFFSLADLVTLPNTYKIITAAKLGDLIESRPHVKAWWEDISSRPAWKKTLAHSAPK